MAKASSPTDLEAGAELGERYRVVAPIASGAMGAVYRALDLGSEREVALKRLLDTRHRARFEIEARLLSSLEHPRVVRVVDHFQEESGSYLVMELVGGMDLLEELERRSPPRLPVEEAVEHVLQACEALQYVHEQQIVHRDVKPQNLIVGGDGVVLVDFGIARELDGGTGTAVIGTPGYMAPEVMAGGRVSARSDVFGLAATLWTLVAGRPPGYGETTALSDLVPGATPGLERALRAGLELAAERRTPSAAALAEALGSRLERAEGTQLAQTVAAPAPTRSLLEAVVRTAARVFDAAAVSVALVEPRSGDLVYQAAWGSGAARIVGVRLSSGDGIAGAVASSGQGVAVPDCRSDPRFAAGVAEATGYVPNTMLVVPLERAGRTIGALSVLDRRDGGPYGAADLDRVAIFAELAVNALEAQPAAFPGEAETLPGER